MFEYILTIGCFDKLHKGDIKLLEGIRKKGEKLIIGLHDNESIRKIKNISDVDSYDTRRKNLEKYAYDIFIIDDVDPTSALQKYIWDNFNIENIDINKTCFIDCKNEINFDYNTKTKIFRNLYTH